MPKLLFRILTVGALVLFGNAARAECAPNQSDVPACLSGTAVAPDYASAVIQENGESGLHQVRQGDIVAGWTVGEIGPGYVELKLGTRTARLELPQSSAGNVDAPQRGADDEPHAVKRGPVKHTRSLARGGE